MERLIDAGKLKKRMCSKCNDEYSDESCEPSDCVFCNAINDAPTVDAVEVVRCRDCKYWGSGKYCESYCNRYGNMMPDINPDDFCSYGERKVGDNNGG